MRAAAILVLLDESRERLDSGHSGELLIAWILSRWDSVVGVLGCCKCCIGRS